MINYHCILHKNMMDEIFAKFTHFPFLLGKKGFECIYFTFSMHILHVNTWNAERVGTLVMNGSTYIECISLSSSGVHTQYLVSVETVPITFSSKSVSPQNGINNCQLVQFAEMDICQHLSISRGL